MKPANDDPMAEISENLRVLRESDVRWAELIGKFQPRLRILDDADVAEGARTSLMEFLPIP